MIKEIAQVSADDIARAHHVTFESLKHVDDSGVEYWLARELQPVLEYGTWDKFKRVIEKATVAAEQSEVPAQDHLSRVGKMVELGAGATREIEDFKLSRYACYLIVQNGDPTKPVIANGQTYFAIQTRRAELADDEAFRQLTEDQKRVFLRSEVREHNKQLVETAQRAGVESPLDFAIFQDHGYRGLYGGMRARDIHERKGLNTSQAILDHMGSTELAANLFRATQAEEKLRRDEVAAKAAANQTHSEVGKRVRETIADIGGTMPEDLPTPDRSVKQLERQRKLLADGEEQHGRGGLEGCSRADQ
jgi:DNA-damage-inducible protein D